VNRAPRTGQDVGCGARGVESEPVKALRLVLPWPPTTNNLYATVSGHRVKSAEGRRYDLRVKLVVWRMFDHRAPADSWPLEPPYRVSIELHAPRRMRYDVANREKAVMDAIFAAIEEDDSTIDDLRIWRGEPDKVNPRCEVLIEEALS
jgi:endodeoxyribonuclease RusA